MIRNEGPAKALKQSRCADCCFLCLLKNPQGLRRLVLFWRHKKSLFFRKGFNASDPEGIRTPDPQIRNLLLYPAELRDLVLKKKAVTIDANLQTVYCQLFSRGGRI